MVRCIRMTSQVHSQNGLEIFIEGFDWGYSKRVHFKKAGVKPAGLDLCDDCVKRLVVRAVDGAERCADKFPEPA